ncbi:hypothetical protein VE00_11194 [Pseudogymnoascus sp. WSF 3629]|nr:hypothetical protein VE00_11194 [Pseudogymnoascus sp. WSF 3629]
MSGSPESQAPATPVPSVVASSTSRSRTVRPYRSPEVEDEAEDPEGSVVPESEAPKDERTVLGWKVAARCEDRFDPVFFFPIHDLWVRWRIGLLYAFPIPLE